MKKIILFASVMFFLATAFSSCKTTENCPAYGSLPVKNIGKSL